MAIGFRVRHPVTGAIKVDGSRRLLIMAGTIIIPAASSGQVISDVFLRGTPFCWWSCVRDDSLTTFPLANLVPPSYSFSGNVMTYNNPGASHRGMYGSF